MGASAPTTACGWRAQLVKREDVELRVFLMGDAVGAALADQQTPEGYYNLARMLKGLIARHAAVGLCGTCLDTRGLASAEFVDGAQAFVHGRAGGVGDLGRSRRDVLTRRGIAGVASLRR